MGLYNVEPFCRTSSTYKNLFKVRLCDSIHPCFILLSGRLLFHCMDILHFLYLFVSWWTSGLFPCFWLSWIKLLWTCMYEVLCGRLLSSILSNYLGVEFLGPMVTLLTLCLTFGGTANLFSGVAAPFRGPTRNVWRFPFLFSTSSPTRVTTFFIYKKIVCHGDCD